MNETVLIIAAAIASLVGSPLVDGLKALYLMVTNKPLEGKPALWVTVVVAVILGLIAVTAAGAFSPPFPADWQGWFVWIGGTIGAIFAAMTVIFKQLKPTPAG